MANTKVTIKVVSKTPVEEMYLTGSVKALGDWDLSKAVKLEYCAECGAYHTSKMLPAGEAVEFKVLSSKDWANVEKAQFGGDVENHSFVAQKGLVVEIEVPFFA